MKQEDERNRKIPERVVTLDEEIRIHCQLWKSDVQFRRLNPYLRDCISGALDAIAVSKTMADVNIVVGGEDSKKQIEVKKYIAIFKSRYLELTDFACEENVNGTMFVIIGGVVKKLMDSGSSVEEYLGWFYDTFLAANQRLCPPGLSLSVTDWVLKKFLYEMKDRLKVRKKDAFDSGKKLKLMKVASDLFDSVSDDSLGEMILKLGENKVSFKTAADFICKFASEHERPDVLRTIDSIQSGEEQEKENEGH